MNPFLTEIYQQPQAIRDTAARLQSLHGRNVLSTIRELHESGKYRRMVFTGMGSSFFISESAACLLNSYGMDACAVNSGELLHYRSAVIGSDTLLFCISQSGESYEVVKLLETVGPDVKVIAVTNEPDSTLARRADHVLLCMAGREEMTSTKTFITCWQNVLAIAWTLAGESPDPAIWDRTAADIGTVLSGSGRWMQQALDVLGDAPYIQLIGRGPAFAAVCQSRLMFMEASHTPASALLGGEFRHGPLEMVGEGFTAILFAHSSSRTFGLMTGLAGELIDFGAKVIFITDGSLEAREGLCVVDVPCASEDMFAIQSVIPVQLLINEWACRKGMTPGDFAHGAKVTARE